MNAQQFRKSLHLGLGRAFIYARDHDMREYRDVILDACLHKNFEPGDHDIVLGWFEAEQVREIRHSFGIDLREFWKQHPDDRTEVRMQRSIYEKDPCSHCREIAVKRLIELDALTESMRAECAYDANSDIRDLVDATGSVSS